MQQTIYDALRGIGVRVFKGSGAAEASVRDGAAPESGAFAMVPVAV